MVPAAAGTPSVNLRPLGVAIGSRRSMVAYYRARGIVRLCCIRPFARPGRCRSQWALRQFLNCPCFGINDSRFCRIVPFCFDP
ncbi:hypothetical protein C4K37_3746 [Pseudomonas chlororaphis subsp. piscium]|nr:hypothetical protein C4K37_3746 [Pseudomonas chlororaphis subsp. piscium]AZC44677.1 hypothetical protein C4K36_3754 [Pseudomonas chlororaphis subsp. piscium]AZC51325.1 hypothetical protein C4K35_3744 [Pseudomonas chlororaphis subsp. piscium]AZC57897.1 hypothetical protein C4K34_3734 [Pseudomonas chlororaphis subsp. piscium]AZC64129.1 hypothetical protein C4K33_3639 [Pseudomonas chlororaphis subsp. piscium]